MIDFLYLLQYDDDDDDDYIRSAPHNTAVIDDCVGKS